jgi:hypothetical protein
MDQNGHELYILSKIVPIKCLHLMEPLGGRIGTSIHLKGQLSKVCRLLSELLPSVYRTIQLIGTQ